MAEIRISIARQQLTFQESGSDVVVYPVSTSYKGTGQIAGSGKTPLGQHVIRAKIGQGKPVNTVFVGRRPTGEIFAPHMLNKYPDRDWILSRIIWLSGKQPGFNRLGEVDSMRRYIYIHGTPYENQLGNPVSHGCIRMANHDVIELFCRVNIGCPVYIHEGY